MGMSLKANGKDRFSWLLFDLVISVKDYKCWIQKCINLAWVSQKVVPEAVDLYAATLLESVIQGSRSGEDIQGRETRKERESNGGALISWPFAVATDGLIPQ